MEVPTPSCVDTSTSPNPNPPFLVCVCFLDLKKIKVERKKIIFGLNSCLFYLLHLKILPLLVQDSYLFYLKILPLLVQDSYLYYLKIHTSTSSRFHLDYLYQIKIPALHPLRQESTPSSPTRSISTSCDSVSSVSCPQATGLLAFQLGNLCGTAYMYGGQHSFKNFSKVTDSDPSLPTLLV